MTDTGRTILFWRGIPVIKSKNRLTKRFSELLCWIVMFLEIAGARRSQAQQDSAMHRSEIEERRGTDDLCHSTWYVEDRSLRDVRRAPPAHLVWDQPGQCQSHAASAVPRLLCRASVAGHEIRAKLRHVDSRATQAPPGEGRSPGLHITRRPSSSNLGKTAAQGHFGPPMRKGIAA